MNILILNWRCPVHPNAGGAEQVTLEHAKGWIAAGHKVYWFSSEFKGFKNKEVVFGMHIVRSGRQFFDVQIKALLWYLFGTHPRFDLVVDQFHGIPFFTPFYVRTNKLALIHEVAKEVWMLNPWPWPLNYLTGTLGYLLEPLVFQLFYKNVPFMTVSESTKKDLIEFGIPKKNIKVIHNGVKLDLPARLPKKENKNTAIFLGAISKDKGIEDAIKCFKLINNKEAGWQFWVVGKASKFYREKVKSWIKEYVLTKNFKYWGFVSDKKKFELLARAHILINPTVREGWGLVNIEANAVGTPIVAYDVPGVRDSVVDGRTGILCKKRTPWCLAEKAIGLVASKRKYQTFSENARKWSKKFTWKKASEKSIKLIEKLTG